MVVKRFCWCCGKVTDTYKNKNTGRYGTFCRACTRDYSLKERHQRSQNFMLSLLSDDAKESIIDEI